MENNILKELVDFIIRERPKNDVAYFGIDNLTEREKRLAQRINIEMYIGVKEIVGQYLNLPYEELVNLDRLYESDKDGNVRVVHYESTIITTTNKDSITKRFKRKSIATQVMQFDEANKYIRNKMIKKPDEVHGNIKIEKYEGCDIEFIDECIVGYLEYDYEYTKFNHQ